MSYLDTYRKRLKASGSNPTDGIIHASKQTVKNNFSNSLFSELVLIDDIKHEVIITQEKNNEDKKILLKPDTRINIGSVVEIKGLSYLTMDFLGDGINEIYPTATLKLCNSSFPIASNETSVLIGYNEFDEPIYEETITEVTTPCVISSTIQSDKTTEAINLPDGQIEITIPYSESEHIVEGKEFNMYNTTYQIIGIDYTKSLNQSGLLIIKGKRV